MYEASSLAKNFGSGLKIFNYLSIAQRQQAESHLINLLAFILALFCINPNSAATCPLEITVAHHLSYKAYLFVYI
jgi:hypothetical protein